MSAGAITSVSVAWASPFDPVSPQAAAIRDLFERTLLLCGAILLLVVCLVAYCVVRFRAGKGREAVQFEGSTRLETAWTIAPILILGGLLTFTAQAMDAADPPIDREPDVTIIGHQWWWEAKYPSGVVTANEIHIPTGKDLERWHQHAVLRRDAGAAGARGPCRVSLVEEEGGGRCACALST